jgi:hypothetical protein
VFCPCPLADAPIATAAKAASAFSPIATALVLVPSAPKPIATMWSPPVAPACLPITTPSSAPAATSASKPIATE